MTTTHYRLAVFGQLAAIGVLGLFSIIIFVGAMPKFYSRVHLADAIKHYEGSSKQRIEKANRALNHALSEEPLMAPAHALRGLIALQQNEGQIARDAYEKLEQALVKEGKPGAPALNGIGCTMLLSARRGRGKNAAQLTDAYAKFAAAIKLDPDNGDAHVNAAICALYQRKPEQAAVHLAQAYKTRNLGYESLIAYHSALGSLFLQAAGQGRATAAAVARKLKDPDARLAKTGRMLTRSTQEFEKAIVLIGPGEEQGALAMNTSMAQARLLAFSRTMDKTTAETYRYALTEAVSRHKEHFPADQRQLARIAAGLSYHRSGRSDLAQAQIQRALNEGPSSSKIRFYAGSAFLHVADAYRSENQRDTLRKRGGDLLLQALEGAALPPRMKFRALSDLAVGEWRARNTSGALKRMTEAAALLKTLEGTPNSPAKSERAPFYRNLAIMLYGQGRTAAATEAADKALKIDGGQGGLDKLFKRTKVPPVVADVRTMTGAKQPPSMPVVSVLIHGGGLRPPLKEEIKLEIDGDPVTFTVGPKSRVYALPRKPLAEGKHTVTVTVSPPDGQPVKLSLEFMIDYKPFMIPRRKRSDP